MEEDEEVEVKNDDEQETSQVGEGDLSDVVEEEHSANVDEINEAAEAPQRTPSIASAEAELDELARFVQVMEAYNSDVEDSIFMVYRKANTQFKGKKGNVVRTESAPIVLFPGTTLDLSKATLKGGKKFWHGAFVTGHGGVMQIVPEGLHAGIKLPLNDIKVTQKALSGSAKLQGTIGLGVSNKIQVKALTFTQDAIKIENTKLEEKNEDGTAVEQDINDIIIDEHGIRSTQFNHEELSGRLNQEPRPVAENQEVNGGEAEAVDQEEEQALEEAGEEPDQGAIPIISKNSGEKLFHFTSVHIEPHKKHNGLYNIDLECNGEKIRLKKVRKDGNKYIHDGGIKFKRTRLKVTTFEFLRGLEIYDDRVLVEERKWRVFEGGRKTLSHARSKGFKPKNYTLDIMEDYWKQQVNGEYFSTNTVLHNDQIGYQLPKGIPHIMNLSAIAKHRGYCPFGPIPAGIEIDADAIGSMMWGIGGVLERTGLDMAKQTWDKDEDRIRAGANVTVNANAIGAVGMGLYAGLARVATAGAGMKFKLVGAGKFHMGTEFEFHHSVVPKSIKLHGMFSMGLNALLQAFARINVFVWEKELYVKTLMAKNLGTVSTNGVVKYDFVKKKFVEADGNLSFSAFLWDTVRKLSEGKLAQELLKDESVIETSVNGNTKEFDKIIEKLKVINDAIKASQAGGENQMAVNKIGPTELANNLRIMQFPVISHLKRAQELVRECDSKLDNKAKGITDKYDNKIEELINCKAQLAILKNWLDNPNNEEKNSEVSLNMVQNAQGAILKFINEDKKTRKLVATSTDSYAKKQNKAAKKLYNSQTKDEKAIQEIDKKKQKNIEKITKIKNKKNLGDAEGSHALLKEYQSIHNSTTLQNHILRNVANRERVFKAIDEVNKEKNGKQITKHSERILKLKNQYNVMSDAERNQANPVFYKLYCSDGFYDPKVIRTQLMGAANSEKFREFTEESLQRGPFGSKKKEYIDAKKNFKNALSEKANILKTGGNVEDVQKRIDRFKEIVKKAVGRDVHMFSSVEDVTIMRRRHAKAQALMKADKESENAVKKDDRKKGKINYRLKQDLMKKLDPINVLIKFEEKYKPVYLGFGKDMKFDLKATHKKFVAETNSEKKYIIAKDAIEEYFDVIAFNPIRGNLRSAIEKGKTNYLYSDSSLQGIDYEGKAEEYQGNAYDQMYKYGPERHLLKKRSVKNHQFVRRVIKDRLDKQKELGGTADKNGITDADVLQYFNYRLSQKRFFDASFAKGSSIHHFFGNAKDFGKVTELSDMLEEEGYEKVLEALEKPQYKYVKGNYQSFLDKRIANIITPNHIMSLEMTRLDDVKNTYAEDKAAIRGDNEKSIVSTKLADALMKKVVKDDAYTVSFNDIVHIEDEEAVRLKEPYEKSRQQYMADIADKYTAQGFYGDNYTSKDRDASYIRLYYSASGLVNEAFEKHNKVRNDLGKRNTSIGNYKASLREQVERSSTLLRSIEEMQKEPKKAFTGDFFEKEILKALTDQQKNMFVVDQATDAAGQVAIEQLAENGVDERVAVEAVQAYVENQEENTGGNAEGIDEILENATPNVESA